jgi:hypothetical protein
MTSRVACSRRGEPLEVLALRRTQHERMPSSETYRASRTAAEALDAWPLEQDAARATLQRADPRGFVNALLADGEPELAVAARQEALGSDLCLRLAESRERDRPADALAVYQRVAGEALETADRRAYRSAARSSDAHKQRHTAPVYSMRSASTSRVREQHRRRPTLIAILDTGNLRRGEYFRRAAFAVCSSATALLQTPVWMRFR